LLNEAKKKQKNHSEEIGSQYAYLSGVLTVELYHAYSLLEMAREELKRMKQELNSIGEI